MVDVIDREVLEDHTPLVDAETFEAHEAPKAQATNEVEYTLPVQGKERELSEGDILQHLQNSIVEREGNRSSAKYTQTGVSRGTLSLVQSRAGNIHGLLAALREEALFTQDDPEALLIAAAPGQEELQAQWQVWINKIRALKTGDPVMLWDAKGNMTLGFVGTPASRLSARNTSINHIPQHLATDSTLGVVLFDASTIKSQQNEIRHHVNMTTASLLASHVAEEQKPDSATLELNLEWALAVYAGNEVWYAPELEDERILNIVRDIFRKHQDHLQREGNKVLTPYTDENWIRTYQEIAGHDEAANITRQSTRFVR